MTSWWTCWRFIEKGTLGRIIQQDRDVVTGSTRCFDRMFAGGSCESLQSALWSGRVVKMVIGG